MSAKKISESCTGNRMPRCLKLLKIVQGNKILYLSDDCRIYIRKLSKKNFSRIFFTSKLVVAFLGGGKSFIFNLFYLTKVNKFKIR